MAKESARLLSAEEISHFDGTFQNMPLGNDMAASAGKAAGSTGQALLTLTQAEEALWLRQQQDPQAVLKHAVAFNLGGTLNLSRLVAALHAALAALPALNVRYRFSHDGELEKSPGTDAAQCLRIQRVDSTAEAMERLLAEQDAAWDLEQDAPIRALVLLGAEATILGFVVHHILGSHLNWETLLHAVSRSYNGRPPLVVEPAGRPLLREAVQTLRDEEVALAPWLERVAGGAGVFDLTRSPITDQMPPDRLAVRYGTVVETAGLSALSGANPTPQALLAAAALLFGPLLSKLGDRAAIDLSLSRSPLSDMLDLALPFCAERFMSVTLPADGTDRTAAIGQIIAGMEHRDAPPLDLRPASEQNVAPRPHVFVTWLTDPERVLPLDGVSVERLPLPSLAPRPDLALGIGWHAGKDRLALEIMAGQNCSPVAAAFILERFAGLLTGDGASHHAPGPGLAFFNPASRGAFAPPTGGDVGQEADAVPQIILAEFRQALSSPSMTVDDDFFDHGGHSLIATRVIGRLLSSHGIEVHFNDLFRHPTAAGLAGHAQRHDIGQEAAAIETPDGAALVAPLSLAQNSLWKIYAAFGFGEIFNLPFALRFLAPIDEAVFARAFQDVLERHSGLRTLFRQQEDGTATQQIVPLHELGAYKWFWSSHESHASNRNQEAGHRFDLSRELPLRLRFMIEEETGQQVLSLLFHHMALDEWSVNLMMDELDHAYRQRAAGKQPLWPEQPAPFHEFALLQHRAGLNQAHLRYWTDRLRDTPRNQRILTRDPSASKDAGLASNAGGWVELKFESAVTEGLYALAKENGASLFNVVYAAIASSLHHLGSLDELVVGTSASGRNNADFFDTIGYFTTVVAHRVGFSAENTLAELIGQVKDTINGSLPNTDIPIDLVEEALGISREQEHLFEVFIQLHAKNKFNGAFTLDDGRKIEFRQVDPERHESVLGLQFEVMEEKVDGERCIRVMMTYRSEHYDQRQVELIRQTTTRIFGLFARPGGARTKLGELKQVLAALPVPSHAGSQRDVAMA